MALTTTTIRGDIAQAVFEGRSNKQNLFIGAEVMPIYVADVKSGEYLKINLGQSEALNDDATKIAAGSAYPRVSRKFVSDTFAATEYGLEEALARLPLTPRQISPHSTFPPMWPLASWNSPSMASFPTRSS
jgi:hypothetical protein